MQIGSLKFMLREEQRQDSALPWSHQSLGLTSDHPFAISLSQAGSDYLMQAFMKNVDQFVRVLHKPTVLKQLNHFRRGILPECDGFQGQLSAIYSLAALSISEDDSMMNFGVERATLLQQFRADVERSLAHLNITTTHKISTLQTFLLHIVSLYVPLDCENFLTSAELSRLDRRDFARQFSTCTCRTDRTAPRPTSRWQTFQSLTMAD